MLKDDLKEMRTLSAKIEIARREAILELRSSLEVIGSYMPLRFDMDFRDYRTILLDEMGVNACGICSTSIAEIVEWDYLTAEEVLNIHCYLVRATQVTILDIKDQLNELESVKEYFIK